MKDTKNGLLARIKEANEIRKWKADNANTQHTLLMKVETDDDFNVYEYEEELKRCFYIYEYDKLDKSQDEIILALYRKAYNSYRNKGDYMGLVLLANLDQTVAKQVCADWRAKVNNVGLDYHRAHPEVIGKWRKLVAFRKATPHSYKGSDTEYKTTGGGDIDGRSKQNHIAYVPTRHFVFTNSFDMFLKGKFESLSLTSIEKSIAAINIFDRYDRIRSSYILSMIIGKRASTKLYRLADTVDYSKVENSVILFNYTYIKEITLKSTSSSLAYQADFMVRIAGFNVNDNKKTLLRKEMRKLVYQQMLPYFADRYKNDDKFGGAIDYALLMEYGLIGEYITLAVVVGQERDDKEAEAEAHNQHSCTQAPPPTYNYDINVDVWEHSGYEKEDSV